MNEILDVPQEGDTVSRNFDYFILTLISLNAVSVVIESIGELSTTTRSILYYFEVVSIAIFTLEYCGRIWTAPVSRKSDPRWNARLKFIASPMAIIDLLAIAPFYLALLFPISGGPLRMLRLLRLTRLIKMGRYSKSLQTIGNVITAKRSDLLVTTYISLILLMISATLMYFAESESQPDVFSNIPDAIWWSVATLTTVGYGDITPITSLGKLVAMATSFLGIGIFALPTAILGSAFLDEIKKEDPGETICPHCGKDIHG